MDMDATGWEEYDRAAQWCASNACWGGRRGGLRLLPPNLSPALLKEIEDFPEEFTERVIGFAYAIAMTGVPSE